MMYSRLSINVNGEKILRVVKKDVTTEEAEDLSSVSGFWFRMTENGYEINIHWFRFCV